MGFHKKIREYFENKGISNKIIAAKIDYSETMVGRYLNKNKPNYDFLNAVVTAFPDIDLNHLFKDESKNVLNEAEDNYTRTNTVIITEIEEKLKELKENMVLNNQQ